MARTSIFQSILNREESPASTAAIVATVPRYRANYEDKLRLIGIHLDQQKMRRINVVEVPGGMLVRATCQDAVTEELLEFPDDTFENHFEDAVSQRDLGERQYLRIKTELIPTSYSDVMRAIGAWLDERLARSVVVSEGAGGIYVTGMWLRETSLQSRYAPFDEFFSPEAVDMLLTEAYERRGEHS
jgi:hypothetical protein